MAGLSIAIIGAGIAGLTAALALAAEGISVTLFERAERIEELGAGIQLSPNATRLLARLNVLDDVLAKAVEPRSVVIRSARDLGSLAEVPLTMARQRWGAPYLVLRRSDLQGVLLKAAEQKDLITIVTGANVQNLSLANDSRGVHVDVRGSIPERHTFSLVIAADGVWSGIRKSLGGPASKFTGHVAYRAVLDPQNAEPFRGSLLPSDQVSTFASPGFHLVSYPLQDGAFNLVTILRGKDLARRWENVADIAELSTAARNVSPRLSSLIVQAGPWHAWPIHEVRSTSPWSTGDRIVLIGDAAHALAPHAAQGAAMAIEDAMLLARLLGGSRDAGNALAQFEKLRRPRLIRVAMRGQFNHFAWQVGGPAALVRNLILRTRSGESLAADFDWLYGYDIGKIALA